MGAHVLVWRRHSVPYSGTRERAGAFEQAVGLLLRVPASGGVEGSDHPRAGRPGVGGAAE